MLRYILRRLAFFIPTLFIISLLTFLLSQSIPGDPVEQMLNKSQGGGGERSAQRTSTERSYNELRHRLNLDLPLFYFSITNANACDTLYRVSQKQHRQTLDRLSDEYGDWENVSLYYSSLKHFERYLVSVQNDTAVKSTIFLFREILFKLTGEHRPGEIANCIQQLVDAAALTGSELLQVANQLKSSFEKMRNERSVVGRFIPRINYYGSNNQYHLWLFGDKSWISSLPFVDDSNEKFRSKGFLRMDFGVSFQDFRPVSQALKQAIPFTLMLSFVSIFLAYMIAIPIGVFSAVSRGTRKEKIITNILFALYSMPNFWIATMLIVYFCGGDFFDLFPAYGIGDISSGVMDNFMDVLYHLILPIFCLTYGSLAFISRQMRGGVLSTLNQDYIRTARAKGLEEKAVVWKHAFRNSVLPLITLLASVFPLAFAGSFIVETIFSIPGMGQLSYQALIARNYPVIFTVMMITAILTMLGNLVADILYVLVDPRISFGKTKN